METVTCSWNVCGVMRTERQEGTCRADARSRHADSGLFLLFVIVAKWDREARPGRPSDVFYDVMMTYFNTSGGNGDSSFVIVKRYGFATSCVAFIRAAQGCSR